MVGGEGCPCPPAWMVQGSPPFRCLRMCDYITSWIVTGIARGPYSTVRRSAQSDMTVMAWGSAHCCGGTRTAEVSVGGRLDGGRSGGTVQNRRFAYN